MSRLTKVKSIHNNEPEFYEANIELYPESMGYEYLEAEMDCINKLGELEDIEEELGCPLDVVFKALSKGIEYEIEISTYFAVDYTIPAKRLEKRKNIREIKLMKYIDKFVFFVPYDYSRSGIVINDIIYLKNYKKTWWLKGEKNE